MVSEVLDKQVPEGYQQTEVGVIPEDWEVYMLDTVANIIDPQPDHRTPPEVVGGEPYIGISNFTVDNSVDWDGSRKIIPAAVDKQQASFLIRPGDIIFGKIGTIGLPKFLPNTSFRYALSANILLIQPNIDPYFIMAWLRSSEVKASISRELHSTSQAAFGIHKMRALLIPLPPTGAEQTAIANALSDVDALITSLEKLITKKRAIKTAAMQQLLTGKKRLPPFDRTHTGYKQTELGEIPEDWEVVGLGKVLSIRHGKSQKNIECENGRYPILATGGEIGRTNVALYDKPSVLIGRKGTIDKPVYRDKPFWTVDTLFYSEVNEAYHEKFIYYKFCQVDWISYNEASGVPSLNTSTIERILQSVPFDKEEQAAIANVLSDMDKEIEALEHRLTKTQQLKLGMMQELLTGRTRLL